MHTITKNWPAKRHAMPREMADAGFITWATATELFVFTAPEV